MKQFNITPIAKDLRPALLEKIDNLTKPKGSLGRLEELALKIGMPMGGRAESLNAAAASTILLWEMARKGGRGHD